MKSFEGLIKKAKEGDQFWSEKASLEFTIQLERLMEKKNISRADLARKIGKSPAFITKLLSGYNNYTIATMTNVVRAIDGRLSIRVTPKEEKIPDWLSVIDGRKTEQAKKTKWSEKPAVTIESKHTDIDYPNESNG